MRYYSASTACNRAIIGSTTGLPGRKQAPVTKTRAVTRARASVTNTHVTRGP
jgi:hypothetical protein